MNGTSGTLLQAIRGPILLITIGVLFAWDHHSNISFWRLWPVLLIVIGVLKLLERYAARPKPDPQPPVTF
jgi:hypothetical protein